MKYPWKIKYRVAATTLYSFPKNPIMEFSI